MRKARRRFESTVTIPETVLSQGCTIKSLRRRRARPVEFHSSSLLQQHP